VYAAVVILLLGYNCVILCSKTW